MGKRESPYALRIKFDHRAQIKQNAEAFGMSMAAFMTFRSLYLDTPLPRTRGKTPVKDHQALAQVAALLGKSHISSNINQLAKQANMGTLPVTPETEESLKLAAQHIAEIHERFMKAMGHEFEP